MSAEKDGSAEALSGREIFATRVWRDPIVAEVRRVRESLFAAAGYDVREFCRPLREEQVTSGHPVVTPPPRPTSATTGQPA